MHATFFRKPKGSSECLGNYLHKRYRKKNSNNRRKAETFGRIVDKMKGKMKEGLEGDAQHFITI